MLTNQNSDHVYDVILSSIRPEFIAVFYGMNPVQSACTACYWYSSARSIVVTLFVEFFLRIVILSFDLSMSMYAGVYGNYSVVLMNTKYSSCLFSTFNQVNLSRQV